jgi:hypothetical protein
MDERKILVLDESKILIDANGLKRDLEEYINQEGTDAINLENLRKLVNSQIINRSAL